MPESLQEAKNRLRKKYIGRQGIHSFGSRPDENAIVVHFCPVQSVAQRKLLKQLRQEAGYEIIEIKEAAPKAAVAG